MYDSLIKKLRAMANTFGDSLPREAADAIEALERNAGCPAWDNEKKICQIMNMPVKEDTDGG